MRRGLCLGALSVVLALSGAARAQDEDAEKGGKKAAAKKAGDKENKEGKEDKEGASKPGASMESEGSDPVNTETAEKNGRFSPKGETGKKESKTQEEEAEKPEKVKPGKGVFGELLIGFGDAPLELGRANEGSVHGTSYGFMLGGYYDFSTKVRLMLRVPYTTARLDKPDGTTETASALGNPEIAGRMLLGEPKRLTMGLQLAIGIPVAQGNPDLGDATDPVGTRAGKVQQFANAANGYREPEIFLPRRMPITPGFFATYKRDHLMLGGDAKIVLAPKIYGGLKEANADGGTYTLNGLAIIPVIGGDAAYEVLSKAFVGMRAWLTWNAIRPYDFEGPATEPSDFQFVLEPRLFAHFGIVTPSAGFLIPIGGELGGNINAFRIHVNLDF